MRLIYFSSVPWSSYAQRPHAMVKYFLEQGGEAVLWVDPYPTRLPTVRDLLRHAALYDQGTPVPSRVSVLTPGGWPVEPIPGGAWLNRRLFHNRALERITDFASKGPTVIGIGRPSALALYTLRKLTPVTSFYDAMDDFPEFYEGLSKISMKRREAAVSRAVATIYVPSRALEARFGFRKHAIVYLPNACEMSALPPVGERRPDRMIIGYVGTIASWFDWRMVIRLARALPYAEIRLVGPCFSGPPSGTPSNVRTFGACRLEDVPAHLATFGAALIPFKRCRLTDGVDPIKYYEYRAMGLPILSTTFGEMARRDEQDGVFFLDHGTDLSVVVHQAFQWRSCKDDIERFRLENDWKVRFSNARLFCETEALLRLPVRRQGKLPHDDRRN